MIFSYDPFDQSLIFYSECSAIGHLCHTFSPKLRVYSGRGWQIWLWKQRMGRAAIERCLLDMTWSLHPWTHTAVVACTRLAHDQGSQYPNMDKGGTQEAPPPSWEATGSWWLMEKDGSVFIRDVDLVCAPMYNSILMCVCVAIFSLAIVRPKTK